MSQHLTEHGLNTGVDVEIGTAQLRRHQDGTVTVLRADRVIGVTRQLLEHPDLAPWVHDDSGDERVLQLDTAGRYRYRQVGTQACIDSHEVLIFQRITE